MTHEHTHWPANVDVIQLSKNWKLSSDGVQWIISKRRKNKYEPLFFIASTRGHLITNLRWNGVTVTKRAQKALDRLPDTFKEWVVDAKARGMGQKA